MQINLYRLDQKIIFTDYFIVFCLILYFFQKIQINFTFLPLLYIIDTKVK